MPVSMLGGSGDNAQAVGVTDAAHVGPVGDAGGLSDPPPTLGSMPDTTPDPGLAQPPRPLADLSSIRRDVGELVIRDAVHDVIQDVLDELDSIGPDLGHAAAQAGLDDALESARGVLERRL